MDISPLLNEILPNILAFLLIVSGLTIVPALLLLLWVIFRLKRIDLPVGADFTTALQHTPFIVVIMLDLLDMSLNFMSAPVGWAILSYLGLQPLRGITVVEGILPGTELLPTMTAAWIAVRLFGKRLPQ